MRGDVPPQADRVVTEPPSGVGARQLPAVHADEAELTGGRAQVGDRSREVFTVALADPLGVPAEPLHGLEDDGRGQPAGRRQLQPVTQALEQPPIRLDGVRMRHGRSWVVEVAR